MYKRSFFDYLLAYSRLQFCFRLMNRVGVFSVIVRIRLFRNLLRRCFSPKESAFVTFSMLIHCQYLVRYQISYGFKLIIYCLNLHKQRVARKVKVSFAAYFSCAFFFVGLELLD